MTPTEKGIVVDFPVFDYRITILITDDIYQSRISRDDRFGAYAREVSVLEGLHSYNRMVASGMIFITEKTSAGTIAHECSHAIWRMFEWIDAKFENEIFAYHLGYLVDQVVLLKIGLIIKGIENETP